MIGGYDHFEAALQKVKGGKFASKSKEEDAIISFCKKVWHAFKKIHKANVENLGNLQTPSITYFFFYCYYPFLSLVNKKTR